MAVERLQKILAAAGVASRRGAEVLIAEGHVTVDGVPATLGSSADPAVSMIAVDGVPIARPSRAVHLLLHKPVGVTSTVRDRHALRTVLDLVPPGHVPPGSRIYPVGRLDLDSEGLLLLTNDGDWAEAVLHPSRGVEREYAIGVRQPLTEDQFDQLAEGIALDEGQARVFHLRLATEIETRRLVELLDPRPGPLTWYRGTLEQGWKRQLRRMFGAVGVPIVRLVRVRIGGLRLTDLRSGQLRPLSAAETRGLATASAVVLRREAGTAASRRIMVALDGPASSGKSSVGAMAARALGYRFCDTGLLYRALTWLAVERGVDPGDVEGLVALVPSIELAPDDHGRLGRVLVSGGDVTRRLQHPDVDRLVSEVARHPAVRQALVPRQRAIAAGGGIIMAGRDIGTVILPHAQLKVYLDASAEERARRRARERGVPADGPEATTILEDLQRRDAVDSTRAVAPLKPAPDASVVATDDLDFEASVRAVVALVRRAERGQVAGSRKGGRP